MEKQNHYYAYKAKSRNGLDTLCIMPISKEAFYSEGQYFPESNVLVLLSPQTREVFDLIEKFKEDGEPDKTSKGAPKVERLRVQNNFNYQLVGNDIKWFADNFVVNNEDLIALVNQYQIKSIATPLILPNEENKEESKIVMTE